MRGSRLWRMWLSAVLVLTMASCVEKSVRVSWKEKVPGVMPADVKTVQVLEFKSQVKYESGLFTSSAEADQSYGRTAATQLSEKVQGAGTYKVIPGGGDLKKFLDNRDVMDALVNEGVMKPDVRDKLQKLSGADVIIVGEASCSAKKDETSIPAYYTSIPMKTINASVTVNFRVYLVKTGDCIMAKAVTKSKGGLGWKAADQAIMPLVADCVNEFALGFLGGEVVRSGQMFAGSKEEELKAMIEPLEAGVDPLRIADKLDAYAKAHPESACALYDLAVIAFIKGDKQGAETMLNDAMMKPGADAKTFKKAYDEMLAGPKPKKHD